MIWLEEVLGKKRLSRIYKSYSNTFPEEERRGKEQFLSLSDRDEVYIFDIKTDTETIGYCIIWVLKNSFFLEHFEIFEAFRNQNYGSQVMDFLTEKFEKIVLESEPSTLSEIASRRIAFYERNGFSIISIKYLQPSYGEGKPEVELYLLSNFEVKNTDELITDIHQTVYF